MFFFISEHLGVHIHAPRLDDGGPVVGLPPSGHPHWDQDHRQRVRWVLHSCQDGRGGRNLGKFVFIYSMNIFLDIL